MQAALKGATARRIAGWTGTLLALVAVALLVQRAIALGRTLGDRLLQVPSAGMVEALALYAAGAFALAVAWLLLARLAGGAAVPARPLLVAHCRAQIAKYLPGNVFHFAWRHAAARRAGIGHAALGGALALESLLLIAAAAILSLGVAADPRLIALAPWASPLVAVAPLLALGAAVVLVVVVPRLGIGGVTRARTATSLLAVLAIDLAFFLLAGIALRCLCAQPDALPLGAWWGWLALAWVVGYVTPGAPAGLGLREAILGLGLGPVLGDAEALAVALCYRLVTVIADAALAAVGFAGRAEQADRADHGLR